MPVEPLRVLLVSQPTTGGAAVCVAALAGAAVAAGVEVTVACPADGELAGRVADAGARWVELPMVRQPGPSDAAALVRLRKLMRRADVVHLHSSKAGALGRLAAATMGSSRPPCVFTPHGWSWLAGERLAPLYRWFERRTVSLADAVIAVSDDDRELGRPVLGPGIARVRVIENGVDVDHFRPVPGDPADPAATRRHDDPVVTCVGRLAHPKGQEVAVQALADMKHLDVRLRLVGDGPNETALRELADELGVAARVDFVGAVGDSAPELTSADVVVIPSWWDGLSLVLLEAMACGAAIVATRVPGAAVLEDAGVIVPIGDHRAMAAALDELLDDASRRAELGRRARQRVEDGYRLETSLERTLALWQELASARGVRLLA